jgi:phenylpyruvate tautomerase PptA (4-oxalocrotonate tautomerase family)
MHSVLIEVRCSFSKEQESALIEAVHAALREAFKIPAGERNIRLIVHEPHRFACAADRAGSEFATNITIDTLTGRALDAKRFLFRAIIRNLEVLKIPAEQVTIVLREIQKENWSVGASPSAPDA